MPFTSQRAPLTLSPEIRTMLTTISRSRTDPAGRVERAGMLLAAADGATVSAIARQFRVPRAKVERCLTKAVQLGALAALRDLPGRGKRPTIPPEARAWVVSLACQKPVTLGYASELWTTRLLAAHIRRECTAAGHSSLARLARGTVSKILTRNQVQPHRLTYYLERRDPEFEAKMAQVLCVYREVAVLRAAGPTETPLVAVLSYDEKPGIQAIENTAPDRLPVPGDHPTVTRDYEYRRHGTVSLLAGIDLVTGHVHGLVTDRHRSREFIAFLRQVDAFYPTEIRIRLVLDNHSAHVSRETRAYLATVPNRFEFIFTPKHGSWLNLVESFFAKMAKSMLRSIRVSSKQELKDRLALYLKEVNDAPVVFRWTAGLESLSVA